MFEMYYFTYLPCDRRLFEITIYIFILRYRKYNRLFLQQTFLHATAVK